MAISASLKLRSHQPGLLPGHHQQPHRGSRHLRPPG